MSSRLDAAGADPAACSLVRHSAMERPAPSDVCGKEKWRSWRAGFRRWPDQSPQRCPALERRDRTAFPFMDAAACTSRSAGRMTPTSAQTSAMSAGSLID